MPKVKLRNWQFDLMRDAIVEKALRENQKVFRIACEFLNEEHEYSDDEAEKVMVTAMSKISDKIRKCVAEKKCILLEDKEDVDGSPESLERHKKRLEAIEELIKQKDAYESLIKDIINRRAVVRNYRIIIQVLEKKGKSKDLIKYYDDDVIFNSTYK